MILNFLTGNRLNEADTLTIRLGGGLVAGPVWTTTDILGPASGEDAIWFEREFPNPSKELAAEIQFMQDAGVAVARDGTWWIWQQKREELYGEEGIFEVETSDPEPLPGQIRDLAEFFRDLVLPAYMGIAREISAQLPSTVQEGNYLHAMAGRFEEQQRALAGARFS